MMLHRRSLGCTLAAALLLALAPVAAAARSATAATTTAQSTAERGPARTRIGAFVTSLSDIQESQRRFDITLWVWLLSPASIGAVDPARTLEITNAALVERQYAVTTDTADGRYSQVKFRASVRAPLDDRRAEPRGRAPPRADQLRRPDPDRGQRVFAGAPAYRGHAPALAAPEPAPRLRVLSHRA